MHYTFTENDLESLLGDLAAEWDVPGAAAGLWHAGNATIACHGVTGIENPLPVDRQTLFQAGSIGKTYTATALVRLAEAGDVDLNAPVCRYLPSLKLRNMTVAKQVTVLDLLSHTAGWEGDFFPDTGEGDDALERFVTRLDEVEQITPPGQAFSYNNAAFCVAGRIIEVVTGTSYEHAIRNLLLEPLKLRESWFFRDEVMTRRFAVGHKPGTGGAPRVARPWGLPRNGAPAGGICVSIVDLLAWARFHLGDGRASDGTRMLNESSMRRMRQPLITMPGSAVGDRMGISWFMRDVSGVCLVGHDGSTNGQEASLIFIPEMDAACLLLTNASPGGIPFNRFAVSRILDACFGITAPEPQPLTASPADLDVYIGEYGTLRGTRATVTADDAGRLRFTLHPDPELLAQMNEPGEVQLSSSVLTAALVAGHADRFVFLEGPPSGITGYFVREDNDSIKGLHLFGRLLQRTADA